MNKKNLVSWIMFDFASSLAAASLLVYFSQWLVVDNHVPDLVYNLILVGSTLLIVLTAPIFSSIADKKLNRLSYLKALIWIEFFTLLCSSLGAMFLNLSSSTLLLIS